MAFKKFTSQTNVPTSKAQEANEESEKAACCLSLNVGMGLFIYGSIPYRNSLDQLPQTQLLRVTVLQTCFQ